MNNFSLNTNRKEGWFIEYQQWWPRKCLWTAAAAWIASIVGPPSSRLAFCCPGHSGAHWIFVGRIAWSACVTASPYPELEWWDVRDPSSTMIDEPQKKVVDYRYVVIAESKVFLVYQVRWPNSINKTLAFNIFQVVRGFLDGLAMFVGINHSFAISATDRPNRLSSMEEGVATA